MGAQQSSQDGGRAGTADSADSAAALPRKTCYYDVLAVERTADEADIRKAYKKKALELHPDRNYNNEEEATKKFSEVQTAYELLSDPQERAWYDSHRDAILRGDDDDDDDRDGAPSEHTTTDDIMTLIGRFNSRVPFTDSPTGFFGVLNHTFDHLAMEEAAASEYDGLDPIVFPPFGTAADPHDSTAKPFYAAWSTFSTRKSFIWKDKWRLSEAPDRRVRRLLEKENKKMRDDAIRDFNDAVRSLVAFVKKRDPRYVPNTQSEAERQQVLRDSAATQAARARAANQERLAKSQAFVVPEWAQSREDQVEIHDEFATSDDEDDDSETQEFECVVCDKVFKSEKQSEAHERSKKHTKAVQQLKRQMKEDGHNFDLDMEESTGTANQTPDRADSPVVQNETSLSSPAVSTKATDDLAGQEVLSSSDDNLHDEYAPRQVVEERLAAAERSAGLEQEEELAAKLSGATMEDMGENGPAQKKIGKAKAKRLRKDALRYQCNICVTVCDSRNKLFAHIEEHHAQPPPDQKPAKKRRRKPKE